MEADRSGLILGPQYDGDDALTGRMRAYQSWYRAAVLDVAPGVGPQEGSTTSYGNYLASEAAERGDNFLTDHIWEVVQDRIGQGGGVERYRCLYNLLSSQPMCFNLFGQFVGRPQIATPLFSALLPDVVGEVEDVRIEWAPEPKGRYLDDATSFDAFVEVRRASDGARGFLAIETKLTEPFSQKWYDIEHRPAYGRLMSRTDGPWVAEAEQQVTDPRWNQLWRNHMLAISLVEDEECPYEFGVPIVVHHPLDARGVEAIIGYRELLQDPLSVRCFDLRQIVDRWRSLIVTEEDRQWVDRFDVRYLQLWLSERAVESAAGWDDGSSRDE